MAVNMDVTIVDSKPSVVSLIDHLELIPTQPPSLYLDVEGVNLSRHGSISIIQLFVLPKNQVFLIDVLVLGEEAFSTSNGSGTNLRSILESALVPKVFFDVRNDSDALFAHFQVSLQGIQDIQLLENATRFYSKDRVVGLAMCIERDAQLTPEASTAWKATKQRGVSYFEPENGGSYQVFNSRPMLHDIIEYCTQDVVYLPRLWRIYTQKISIKWSRKVGHETSERVRNSQTASYEPHGRHKTLSPWAKPAKFDQGNRPANTVTEGPGKKAIPTLTQKVAIKADAAKETAPTHLETKPKSQASVGIAEPQLSANIAASKAAHEAPRMKAELERPLSKIDIPIRSETKLGGRSHKETDPDLHPATIPSKWTCTSCCLEMQEDKRKKHVAGKQHAASLKKWTCMTCGREMQEDQKEEHLAGKQHTARVKRTATEAASGGSETATTKEKTLGQTTIPIRSSRMGETVMAPKPRHSHSRKAKEAGTNRRNRPAAVPKSQERGLPYPPDYLFSEFGGRVVHSNFQYETAFSMDDEDLNYGLCDKDCGWCGHCMNGVDI